MSGFGLNNKYALVGYKKCICFRCLGIIPIQEKIYNTLDGYKMTNVLKSILKDSLLPRTHTKPSRSNKNNRIN